MEKTAYFQRYLNVRSMVEIKIANSARRPSMPILKLPKLDTSLKSIETAETGRKDKENQHKEAQAKENLNKENREK